MSVFYRWPWVILTLAYIAGASGYWLYLAWLTGESWRSHDEQETP